MQVPPSVREDAVAALRSRRPGVPVLDLVRDSRMHDYPHADEDETPRVLLFGRGDDQVEVRVHSLGESSIEVTAALSAPREMAMDLLSPTPGLHLSVKGRPPLSVSGSRGPSSLLVTSWDDDGNEESTRQTSWVVL